jgi:hypothetical protein
MTRTAAGYIGLSHPEWCDTITRARPHRCAFWRGSDRAFRVLEPGAPFFLLKNARIKRPIEDRAVIGSAEYLYFDVRRVNDLPNYYGLSELGVGSAPELHLRLREIAGREEARIGVVVLGPLEPFRFPVTWTALPDLGIRFAQQVVSGMGLDAAQVERLLDAGLYGRLASN